MIDKRILPDSLTIKKVKGKDDWGKRRTLTLFIYPLANSTEPSLIPGLVTIVAKGTHRL